MTGKFELDAKPHELVNMEVLTPEGTKVRLGQLWSKQPVIFIFLRHFACIACRAHAKQVWEDKKKYENTGGVIVFIGNGEPTYIDKFKEDLGMKEAAIFTDPSLETFRAAGFYKGFSYIVHTKTIVNAIKLMKEGHRQVKYTKEAGTHWQLGGVLVINQKGEVKYHYISEYFGDLPEEPYYEIIVKDEESA